MTIRRPPPPIPPRRPSEPQGNRHITVVDRVQALEDHARVCLHKIESVSRKLDATAARIADALGRLQMLEMSMVASAGDGGRHAKAIDDIKREQALHLRTIGEQGRNIDGIALTVRANRQRLLDLEKHSHSHGRPHGG